MTAKVDNMLAIFGKIELVSKFSQLHKTKAETLALKNETNLSNFKLNQNARFRKEMLFPVF